MQFRPWLFSFFFLGQLLYVKAQPFFSDLQGQELLDAIILDYKPSTVLSYSDARDTMYAKIYNVNDSVACVYSGHKIYLPSGIDPSTYLSQNGSNNGINCEHTFPQSKGASTGNPESDMHHLFPTRAAVNTARDNFPFSEIPDAQTTQWYYLDQVLPNPPSNGIQLYSERKNGFFEPREDHKGNVARAMFYFYTMYKAEADAADPIYFANQQQQLCAWHYLDPADSLEIQRSWQIASYQDGRPNPFVMDCTLAGRIYCQDISGECPILPTAVPETINFENGNIGIYPNPVRDGFFSLMATSPGTLRLVNGSGIEVGRFHWAPNETVSVGALPAGLYFIHFQSRDEIYVGKLLIEAR